jgi:ABC-type branched-subunit amino acid transport system ATPase component
MLKLENIHAGYGPKEILHGVSLEVATGEIVALLGPNGAGKSTILKVISGFLMPAVGSVTLNEKEITQIPTYQRIRSGIGYVMQNGSVFGSLTVSEHFRLINSERCASNFPLSGFKRGGVLSGGERQRLATELCLQQHPKLLLLDEPSAGVSPGIAVEIYRRIKEQICGTDTAVLVVEQNLQFLPGFATRIVVMRNGGISKENLPLDQLKNTETIFSAFYGE